MPGRYLAVVDRAYRGGPEVQFCDLLYLARGLHRQLGGLDVVLRGSAVTFAVDTNPLPRLRVGARYLDLPDPRRSLRALLAADSAVSVDEPALRALGLTPDRVLPGVVCRDSASLTRDWPDYEGVWFL
ncbi:hypothetical protein Lfu02_74150 [Longispora fulva]|uniref:Uncharacterized protein n=1 Tax=Longispora fulva TaxID=619741 RepID=A0A8J7G9T2_9ACTN|nr:hypothetical protein [Longispora fulva]MBG6134334.1 hypothetical protein [Longispora fulva]GIG63043.1 hypothetical protein Lfu02_74150 [Longispora fulva]